MSLRSLSPATGKKLRTYPAFSVSDTSAIIDATHTAWLDWRDLELPARARCLREVASRLNSLKHELAEIITAEMGKPLKASRSEIEKCAWVCEYFADNAQFFLHEEPVKTEAAQSYIHFEPLGVILAVMPWNFPFWQLFRFAAPALMAGNACVLKHASNVSGCALAIEQLFREAGSPGNLLRTLLISSDQVEDVIWNDKIRAVTLTGSTAAGREIAATAGRALKKTVLELGGSDPYLVLADADIEYAARTCASSRLINTGQSCIAAKRFIVVEAVYEKFESAFVEKMKQAKMGDPMQEDTELGPLAREDLRDALHKQVRASVEQGAQVLLGGAKPEGAGNFYPATVLAEVAPGMPVFDEETFGPVAALIRARDEAEAIQLANKSIYGLGSAVFSKDTARAEAVARQLETGFVAINDFVRSDPRLPFGGVKDSGYGRELGPYGIKEFVNIKTVYIK
ncbi:MAG TPA: NAD-dependent succinate-semialdehyde dehydrogenase [Gammaproteobacteria bacterium]|nr:NAD-dependent succinate-semialdehyde dehydrogenase [Gammaproteobacteria bacterium]